MFSYPGFNPYAAYLTFLITLYLPLLRKHPFWCTLPATLNAQATHPRRDWQAVQQSVHLVMLLKWPWGRLRPTMLAWATAWQADLKARLLKPFLVIVLELERPWRLCLRREMDFRSRVALLWRCRRPLWVGSKLRYEFADGMRLVFKASALFWSLHKVKILSECGLNRFPNWEGGLRHLLQTWAQLRQNPSP